MSTKISGGNCNIIIENGIATKKLRNTSNESVTRFSQELEIATIIKNLNIDNVVKILDVVISENKNPNIKATESYITMNAYDGNLVDLLPQTKNNLPLILKILEPMITALKALSDLEVPIYHRDIKPDNILYKQTDHNIQLYLADFGCSYMENSNRITEDSRAVGARLFMSPEAELGKVKKVTTALDIYSLGKLIWWMFNGEEHQYLPYNLWYIDEYNLSKIFDNSDSYHANNIIAACLKINPTDRCSYDLLLSMIQNFFKLDTEGMNGMDFTKLKQLEEKKNLELEQNTMFKTQLCKIFYLNIKTALHQLIEKTNSVFFTTILENIKNYESDLNRNIFKISRKYIPLSLAIFNETTFSANLNRTQNLAIKLEIKNAQTKNFQEIIIETPADIELKLGVDFFTKYLLEIHTIYLGE